MGVRLVVERCYLAVPGRAVQADRLVQGAVGLQPYRAGAAVAGTVLQLGKQPAAEAEPADRGRHPHPLDLRGLVAVELQRAAADRLAAQGGDQEQPGRRAQLLVIRRDAQRRVEPVVEAARQFAEVGAHAAPRLGLPRAALRDQHRRGDKERLHLPFLTLVSASGKMGGWAI
jgi:hypothetical protein